MEGGESTPVPLRQVTAGHHHSLAAVVAADVGVRNGWRSCWHEKRPTRPQASVQPKVDLLA